MIIKADRIADLLENPSNSPDPLVVTPQPNLHDLRDSGAGSIDLRLGTWLVSLRQSRSSVLATSSSIDDVPEGENRLTKRYFVPFGGEFILHPGYFVLGATMEWLRIPSDLSGYVVGKSSWGRRGLIIATAVGVHPGFCGCLTLEITNLGEVPMPIVPGMQICQLFLHRTDTGSNAIDQSAWRAKRRPTLGTVQPDDIAKKLARDGP